MRANLSLFPFLILSATLFFSPVARAEVDGCPETNCVESYTSLVLNEQTNMMDAYTSAKTDYNTAYWYDLCVNLAIVRLNGPYLVNETVLLRSLTPSPCTSGGAELDMSGSVPATPPGRQFAAFGSAELHVYFEYAIIVPYPTCGQYCEGSWYDAFGYSCLYTAACGIAEQPSGADWPSIVYTYPFLPVAVPVLVEEISMSGSTATAWSPPVIYSVNGVAPPGRDQWPAGATTTVTIKGAGFGYSPSLTISGGGITGYTNPCAPPNSSAACDTQIVATVTVDANTPSGSVETITVTANGLNPSGFLPVPIEGQSGQATAQATTQAFVPPVPQIWFNGSCVSNSGSPSCPGNPVYVVVGQQIALTIYIPSVSTPASNQWTRPTGTIVGGYTPTPQSFQTGEDIKVPNTSQPCQHLDQSCLTFYWVTPSAPNASWQVSYSYTYNNQTSQTVTALFNVTAPTGLQVTGSTGVPDIFQHGTYGPSMGFVPLTNPGVELNASATNPQEAPGGSLLWVQLLNGSRSTFREGGPYSGPTGVVACIRSSFANDPSPELDNKFPYTTGSPMNDSPADLGLSAAYPGDVAGENKYAVSFSTYLMWHPNLPNSIPVPLGSVAWQWACDAVNTLTPQSNRTNWIRVCAVPQTPGSVQFSPGASYPTWRKVDSGETITLSCQYQ
jgi:hypothetical protein